jgi:hypothetical protein
MFTRDDWPRRGALGALIASSLALVGLGGGTELRAAKKKNKKKKTKKPNPPAKLALVPGTIVDFEIPQGGTNFEAASACPTGTFAVTRNLILDIIRSANPTAEEQCRVILDGPDNVLGWLGVVKCEGGAIANGSVTAFCLPQ